MIVALVTESENTGFTYDLVKEEHLSDPLARRSIYLPSNLEKAVSKRSRSEFEYDKEGTSECSLFLGEIGSNLNDEYKNFVSILEKYTDIVRHFDGDIFDVRQTGAQNKSDICQSMNILSIFPKGYLSFVDGDFIEPLLPPLRHPRFCESRGAYMFDINYLIHDFCAICENLRPDSRTIFFDIGASLEFHGGKRNPALLLVELYSRFGIKFDHYYAFEQTPIPDANVYTSLPHSLLTSYHWYNVGVERESSSKNNPWFSILSQFEESDFVVIKLDIDTPLIELPLTRQLMSDNLSNLVDHFYFEHHVRMKTMMGPWGDSANGTIQDSLDLFAALRQKGVAAHSWV